MPCGMVWRGWHALLAFLALVAWLACDFKVLLVCNNPSARPQTREVLLSSREVEAAARMASFGRNWPLAAPPGPGTARNQQLRMVASSGLSSQALATILGQFRKLCLILGLVHYLTY